MTVGNDRTTAAAARVERANFIVLEMTLRLGEMTLCLGFVLCAELKFLELLRASTCSKC